jgi:hypothetical protein
MDTNDIEVIGILEKRRIRCQPEALGVDIDSGDR